MTPDPQLSIAIADPVRVLATMALVVVGPIVGVWLLYHVFRLLFAGLGWTGQQIGRFFGHLGWFIGATFKDVGAVIAGVVGVVAVIPMALGNVAAGRWQNTNHFSRAILQEVAGLTLAVYRLGVSNPLRLVGLGRLVEDVERRIPEVVDSAPGRDPSREELQAFEGYEVLGNLPAGGSGARLFLAKPTDKKRESLARSSARVPGRVVIKSFALATGSTLPQIIRESRALEAAKKLGLVLEHQLTPARFHYVMPYVPGDDLGKVGKQIHVRCRAEGLSDPALRAMLGYSTGLIEILARFHAAGLWHKDIKPSNIIVAGDRVELVDLGLVTPLASAMTLTTHGTEYYRDPELVRLAMQGVKVNEVDGVKFDLYSAGAVLFSLIEDDFPAHGNLSRITKRCPDALRWIIRRSMADLRQRYASAEEMLADLRVLLEADNPFAVKPAQLPSMGGAPAAVKADWQADPALAASLAASSAAAEGIGDPFGKPDKPAKSRRKQMQDEHRAAFLAKRAERKAKHAAKHAEKEAKRAARQVRLALAVVLVLGGLATVLVGGATSIEAPQPVAPALQVAPRGSVVVPVPAQPAQSAHTQDEVSQHLLREGARVLLLATRDGDVDDEVESELYEVVREQLGWQPFGELSYRLDGGSDWEKQMIAKVRQRVLLSSLGESEASLALVDLIASDPELDGVLWYEAEDDEDGLRMQLFSDPTWGHAQVEDLLERREDRWVQSVQQRLAQRAR
jgi:serine/threonine protein kinase